MKRRALLLTGTAAAGALVVGWGWLPPRSRLGAPELLAGAEAVPLNGWIRVASDGSVELAMPRSEMGQGVHTALAMLVAEELDLRLDQLRLIEAGHDTIYGNVAMLLMGHWFHPRETEPGAESRVVRAAEWFIAKLGREFGINATGGSSSVADAWGPLRLAAATARARLLGAASLQWKLPVGELSVEQGVVRHASGPTAHYGELVGPAAHAPAGDVAPKAREHWRLIGTDAPRLDVDAKSRGAAEFGIDVRPPGLVFAAIRHCPMLGGGLGAVDVAPALARPGVERVVRLGPYGGSTAALAVVARSSWHAMQGAQALQVEWHQRPAGALDSRAIERQLAQAARHGKGFVFHQRGDAASTLARAARRIEALYQAPYLAHMTMEPQNCTARVADGRVEVWVPTQAPGIARAAAARAAGVDEAAVTVHVTYLGGGFGRRLDVDVVGQAVRVARETGGRPVQLLWSREEDTGHDFYRPAGAAWMSAALDPEGRPTALAIRCAGDAIVPRWIERALPALAGPFDLPDRTAAEGLFGLPYDIPHQRISQVATRSGVPVGFWRSVGHSHHAFFSEGFVDELAHAAGADPVAWRLARLGSMPRHAAVLKLAAAQAGWGRPLPAGRARGVALHESFGSIVAEVVEASLEAGQPRVHRVDCAIDCGTVVNPRIVAQQMESAVVFGLAAALHGRIDIEGGVVQQRNFPDQPLPTLAQTPVIQTHIVPSTNPPGGVGEPGTPPLAPALAGALFALTGERRRRLPFSLGPEGRPARA